MALTTRINADDVAFLLIDHQSGLFQTVKDIEVPTLRSNVVALSQVAAIENIPVITTASEPKGPNGPLMTEIHENAPHAQYVGRTGEVNAWDAPAFVEAVKAIGKKKLVIAGVLTSVCVAFPAISAISEGYEVFPVIDASGDMSPLSTQVTISRLQLAGVIPITTTAVISEILKSWKNTDAAKYAHALSLVMPNYQALIESYYKAQEVALESK
ncbi:MULTISPECIES: isochorismatase family protein [Sphingobacterium]|jgi:nicotinamidase-related amidase|uniref:Putative hydrolase YcaC n=1 Tax=Sphingobacterium multivorum TaxID=28454 RepID=A0A653XZK2_SPHMU|nr:MULTISPECIES: isochorismatase family protein [Sphingobacterium]HBI88610.1 amidohydrolase [Sphingobacterium sp.]QQT47025.1 isochorismatase family protein [Sphingobacterium multivorum]QQT60457.1 isochorismatase family protein [Sphingobacterium multivorum]SUJ88553.1 Isochorismatase family [Sphingobacterium multivorum]VXC35585.1 putative hydrolase YcaC [Sphingobacterium multivorum]